MEAVAEVVAETGTGTMVMAIREERMGVVAKLMELALPDKALLLEHLVNPMEHYMLVVVAVVERIGMLLVVALVALAVAELEVTLKAVAVMVLATLVVAVVVVAVAS